MNSCAVEITTSAFVVVNFTISCMNGYPERAVREKMVGFWEGNKGEKDVPLTSKAWGSLQGTHSGASAHQN